MGRGLLARLFGSKDAERNREPIVHDFTYEFSVKNVTMVKPVDDFSRAFIAGKGNDVAVGDLLIVKGQVSVHAGTKLRYRVESISHNYHDESWRAYGRLEQAQPGDSASAREKRFQAWQNRRS